MKSRTAASGLLVALIVGAGIAAFRTQSTTAEGTAVAATAASPSVAEPMMEEPLPPNHPALPAGHPAVGAGAGGSVGGPPSVHPDTSEAPALAWSAPDGWSTVPNPNAMRLATYRVTTKDGDGELRVTRAGGATDANIERWLGQFDDAGHETRTVKTQAGFKITIVEVNGTYLGDDGMGSTAPHGARKDWMLRGAIVETSGTSYFFKLVAPAAVVKAARPGFDAVIASMHAPK